jgi:pimeloyl-ACP methyl ester carboxylesterase
MHGFGRSEPSEPEQRALIWDYNYLVRHSQARAHHSQDHAVPAPLAWPTLCQAQLRHLQVTRHGAASFLLRRGNPLARQQQMAIDILRRASCHSLLRHAPIHAMHIWIHDGHACSASLLQVDDLCQFAAAARTHHASSGLPSVPWFLAGFSLGGLTAALAALRKQQAWQGIVLVSACMWVRMTLLTRLQRMIGPVLNYLVPTSRIVQRLDPGKDLNPDPDAVSRCQPCLTCACCWLCTAGSHELLKCCRHTSALAD